MVQIRQKVDDIKQENEKTADGEYEKLVKQMKGYREQKGVSLTALSVKTQTYASYIQRVENARINTSVKKLIVLLDALGLELVIRKKEERLEE